MSPWRSFLTALGYILTKRLRFPRQYVGETLAMKDGRRFTVFRHVVIVPKDGDIHPEALFCVRFHLARMSPAINNIFSWLPVPFFIGLPGFCAKFWMLDEASGDYQGLYAWQTAADAGAYARSFAIRFMTRRAVPGSVSHQILSTTPEEGAKWLAMLECKN